MQQRKNWLARFEVFAISAVFAALSLGIAAVAPAAAQAVTRSYRTDVSLQRGMIVRKSAKDDGKVEALKAEDIVKMEGVIVAANDSPVTLSSENLNGQQVFVATTGQYYVLVSNQGGAVKKDDYITISALAGVGMKAGTEQSRIIGRALDGFDGKTNISGRASVRTAKGESIPVTLGMVPAEISVSRNPLEQKVTSLIPGLEFAQQAAGDIVKKDVSPTQLYLAIITFSIAAIIAGSILYAGIRTSMIAIGRNPLAKKSIMRQLVSVVITSIIVLIIGMTAVYLILKL